MPPRYYKHRLWKVSWACIALPSSRLRIVKHYERRETIGAPWQYVRGVQHECRR